MSQPVAITHTRILLLAALVAYIIAIIFAFWTSRPLDDVLGIIAIGLGLSTAAAIA